MLTSRADGRHVTATLIHRKPDAARELWLDAAFVAIEIIKE
jgi:hypothetical protein